MNNNLIVLASKLKKFNNSFIQKKHRIVTDKTIHNSSFLFFTFFLREKAFLDSPYRNILINYFRRIFFINIKESKKIFFKTI